MESGDSVPDNVLTIQLLKSRSNEFDVTSIHTVSLSGLGLSDISAIGACVGLERLDLSCNDINHLHALSSLNNLLTLDLSVNRITSLNGLQALDKLERVDLSGNLIGSADILNPLVTLQSLQHLRLFNSLKDMTNPLCMKPTYRDDVLKLLPHLESLDGEILKGPSAKVFSLMSELERELIDRSSPLRNGPVKTASLPRDFPDDMFVIESKPDEEPSLAVAQFKSSLKASEDLSSRGSQLIEEAQRKLRAREKV